ncbi:MAG: ABC transporter substrate-binding protein [Bacteroidaceae bacterium]
MNTKLLSISLLITILFAFSSCGNRSAKVKINEAKEQLPLSYAKGFSISKADKYTIVTVFNPWKEGAVYDKYYLVKSINIIVPEDGKKVIVPLKSLVSNSATHLEFLQMLGEIDKVTGVCSASFIYNPAILQRVKEGKTRDLGDSFNLDIENLLLLRPQAVMTSAYDAEDENTKKLAQTGLTVIYNIEWQEKSLLARAEWIKFVGAFFDKTDIADSLFQEVEQRYNNIKSKVMKIENKPSILSGQDFRGTWTMPAGKSFNAQLYREAGGRYFYENENTSGSISSTIEETLIRFSKADVWIGAQANSLKELGEIDEKYKLFKAYKEGQVYNFNKRTTPAGGNDYWESAIARPDLLLADMIKVLHPTLLPEHEFFYIQKLK